MKDEERFRLISELNKRIGSFTCPICHKGQFKFVDSYSSNPLSDDYTTLNLGGKMIPYVMLVCDNCGFISQHALGTLGVLPQQSEKNGNGIK